MKPEIETMIETRMQKLPSEVVKAIKSVPWVKKMQDIAKNHHLDEEKTRSFEAETTAVILAFESPKNYADNLFNELKIKEEEVLQIAKEVGLQIFSPIQDKIEQSKKAPIVNTPEKVETLKSLPDTRPETQEIAPRVVVETSKFKTSITVPSINLIPPPPEEKMLTAPKIEVAPKPIAPNISTPTKVENPHYAGSVDPYREQI